MWPILDPMQKKTTESFLWFVDDRMTNNWSLNYINYTQPGLTPKWRFSCFIQASSRPAVRPLLPVDLLSAEKPPWWFPRCQRRLHACNVWKVTHAVPCEVLTPGLSFLPMSSGSSLDIFLTNTTTVRWLTLPKKRSSRGDGGLWTGGRVDVCYDQFAIDTIAQFIWNCVMPVSMCPPGRNQNASVQRNNLTITLEFTSRTICTVQR